MKLAMACYGGCRFRTVAVLTVLLPLTGFVVCVAWSLIYDFKGATATHCGVIGSNKNLYKYKLNFMIFLGGQLSTLCVSCHW